MSRRYLLEDNFGIVTTSVTASNQNNPDPRFLYLIPRVKTLQKYVFFFKNFTTKMLVLTVCQIENNNCHITNLLRLLVALVLLSGDETTSSPSELRRTLKQQYSTAKVTQAKKIPTKMTIKTPPIFFFWRKTKKNACVKRFA